MTEGKDVGVEEMKAAGFMFADEMDAMNKIKQAVYEAVNACPGATSQTIGRQALDHLDASALFIQNLGMYLKMTEEQVEAGVAAQPNLKVVDGDKS
jgi:hypothetical protein